MRKKNILLVIVFVFSLFLIAACRQTGSIVVAQPSPSPSAEVLLSAHPAPSPSMEVSPSAQPTPSPSAEPSPSDQPTPSPLAEPSPSEQPAPSPAAKQEPEYVIENDTIYLQTPQEKRLVYIAAPHYEAGAECHIWNLLVDDDKLYFIETRSDPKDNGDIMWSIIRIDDNGRHVLAAMTGPFGYAEFVFFQDRIIYAIEGGDSCSIGDMKKDGSQHNKIMDGFAHKYGSPYFGGMDYIRNGSRLLLEGNLYLHLSPSEWLEGEARIIIYPDLRTELEWLTEPEHHD